MNQQQQQNKLRMNYKTKFRYQIMYHNQNGLKLQLYKIYKQI
jgi:hypothetical protein